MSDKFDQRLREKLGGFETPFEPTDWAALSERLDARDTGSNRRIALILFGAILLGSAVLGVLYQTDMRHAALAGEVTPDVSGASDKVSATPLLESPTATGNPTNSSASEALMQGEGGIPNAGANNEMGLTSSQRSRGTAALSESGNQISANAGLGVPKENLTPAGSDAVPAKENLPAASSDAVPAKENLPAASSDAVAAKTASSAAASDAGRAATTNSAANPKVPAQHSPGALKNQASFSDAGAIVSQTPAARRTAGSASLAADAQTANASSARQTAENPLEDQPNSLRLVPAPDQGMLAPGNAGSNSTGVVADSRLAALIANPLYPMTTMAASHDPFALPQDRSWAPEKRDISLRKTPVRWALAAGPGLNTALTAFGDGFRPAWDIGVAGEAWFGSGAFVSAGLRYGVYRFQQSDVACGDHAAHGLSDAVHCPDAMLGDESLWEIPLQAGYGMDLKKVNGRFRVFGGISARISRQANYHVEFHDVSAGDTLFFDPVVISVAPTATTSYPENYTYDANDLQDMTAISTATSATGNEQSSASSRTSLAVELGFGYEQFLAPTVSLGIQPRLDIPLNRLPMGEGRAYHLGMNAMLRWYPNWSR